MPNPNPHRTPEATRHTRTIDVRLPPTMDGQLLQELLTLLDSYGFEVTMHLLAVGNGHRVRLLGTPEGSADA